MKIIINQPRASYFVGGAEMISFEHAKNMLNMGNDVYFFTISPESIEKSYSIQYKNFNNDYSKKIHFVEIKQNVKAKEIYKIQPGEDRSRWNVESIYYNQELYDYLNNENLYYDVIFSYYNLDAVFLPTKVIGKNVLYLCGIPHEQNDFQGSFLKIYDKVIAISNEVKESWSKFLQYDVPVVSTGVDCNRFKSQNINGGENVLLFVGRIISRKNVGSIIEAYKILKRKYDLQLYIVGDGPDRTRVEKNADDTIFVGNVSNPEYYYAKANIFITPSEYGEGLQGTILEAMSSGLTVVATNTNINNELLSDGRGIVTNIDVDSIVSSIEKALNSDRELIAKKSREFVEKYYDWAQKTKELLEVI